MSGGLRVLAARAPAPPTVWRTAQAAKRSADTAAREFGLARKPRIRVGWGATRAVGQSYVHVHGIVRETANISTTVRRIDSRVDVFYGSSYVPTVRGAEGANRTLRGDELFYRFSVTFDVPNGCITGDEGHPLAAVTVKIEVSVDEVSEETWRYEIFIAEGAAPESPSVDVLSVVLERPAYQQNSQDSRVAAALCRAWKNEW